MNKRNLDGPDAPYPGMASAFEAHTGQSWTDPDWRRETATWATAWKSALLHNDDKACSCMNEETKIRENGPWSVVDRREGKIVIQSDDFHFDAALEVSGDFPSEEVKRDYADEICQRLNAYEVIESVEEGRK